jgi:hypothetical protein
MSSSLSRLRAIAQRPPPLAQQSPDVAEADLDEHCDLCNATIGPEHRHLLDVEDRSLRCVCRPCSILFDHRGAGGGHVKLLPDRVRALIDLALDDGLWQSLDVPVDLAFFFESSPAGRVVAFYPAPVGATESLLELGDWRQLVEANPVLGELEPDVEALLLDRRAGRRDAWLVPVDRCYELVGTIRSGWRGFGGGEELLQAVDDYFEGLRRRARPVTREGKEAAWPTSGSASPT